MEDESIAGEDMEQEETAAAEDSSNAVETSNSEPMIPSDAASNVESEPAEEGGPIGRVSCWNARNRRHEGAWALSTATGSSRISRSWALV